MGTPAFPNLGKHCSVDDCHQIDFLPFTCDRCKLVFCLQHRSYGQHRCPHGDNQGVTVVICPLCAKGVRLIPEEDPNITWEKHVNTICDPSNYEKATKKRKCPVAGCREILVFSNTIKCRDCNVDHCLKHRFGPDHKCPGPRKPYTGFQFSNLMTTARNENTRPNRASAQPSSAWTRLVNAATAGMAKLSTEFNQTFQVGQSSGISGAEVCPQCNARFSSVTMLVEHVEKVHGKSNDRAGVRKLTVDVCPKCSKGFRDPVALVEHVERDHGGTSKA